MGRVMRTLAVLAAVVGVTPAAAQGQVNDPSAGSPSGTIYEIPLDSARNDAAPRQRSAESAAAGQPSNQPASSIHSADNGFGSSAQVPGVPVPARAAGGGSRGKAKSQAKARKRSTTLSGGAAGAAAPNTEALIRPAARAAAPSSTRAYVLLALAAGVALALGAAARLAARRR